MFDRLDFIEEKYEELGLKLSDPEVINDQRMWQKFMKEHAEMTPIVEQLEPFHVPSVALTVFGVLSLMNVMAKLSIQ